MAIRPMPVGAGASSRFRPPLSQMPVSKHVQTHRQDEQDYGVDDEIEDFVDFPNTLTEPYAPASESGAYGYEPFSEAEVSPVKAWPTPPTQRQPIYTPPPPQQAQPSRPPVIRPVPRKAQEVPAPVGRAGLPHDQGPRSIKRRQVSELPDIYRNFFGFPVFNPVQSACFEATFHSPCNVVVTSPTGTGKTVIFELAIIRLLEQNSSARVVYLAPTKSLCSERYQDWTERFRPLGVRCVELTGDTGTLGLRDVKEANIIVTTPEKHDYGKILGTLRLLCLDEVHLLREERGSVLEVVVSRMKTLGTNIRFVALSATVPIGPLQASSGGQDLCAEVDIEDVGAWIGNGGHPSPQDGTSIGGAGSAVVFRFGEEYRPVKLAKFVYGYRRPEDQSEFAFLSGLNYKLMDLIKQHASGKPTLIFCGTRKSTKQAADALAKAYQRTVEQGSAPWPRPTGRIAFDDKELNDLVALGIGFHHGGVEARDRKNIEQLFTDGSLGVLCTTSTLSVGVNLPARCVILRGTKLYAGSKWESYTDLDFMQMMGRAGRPQFDTEGVAVIMCEMSDKQRLERLVRSETILESCLHKNLTEHINSEVALGTLVNVEAVLDWLRNSFLYVRIQKNPAHYALSNAGSAAMSPDKQLEEHVRASLDSLAKDGMLTRTDETGDLQSTDLGDIMSKFLIKYSTFLKLLEMKPRSSLRNLLEVIAKVDEFSSLKIRAGEAAKYNAINSNPDIRFHVAGKVTQTWQKLFLLIQAVLGGISLNELKADNANPHMEMGVVWQSLPRICKCATDLAVAKRDTGAKQALELHRSVQAKAWEAGAPAFNMLRQLEHIGEKSSRFLAEAAIVTIDDVRRAEPSRIEVLLNRNPPFGRKVIAQARSFPQFRVELEPAGEEVTEDGVLVEVEVRVSIATEPTPVTRLKNGRPLYASVLVMTSDAQWVEFRRIKSELLLDPKEFTVSCILVKPSQRIQVHVASEHFAGLGTLTEWTPTTARGLYPKPRFSDPAEVDDEVMVSDVLEGLEEADLDMSPDEAPTPVREKPVAALAVPTKPTTRDVQKSEKTAPTKRARFDEDPESDRLPNGRYRCGHSCKSCNHECCKNGMAKPSHARRKHRLQQLADSPPRSTAQPKPTATVPRKALKKIEPIVVAEDDVEDLPDLSTITGQKPHRPPAPTTSRGDLTDLLKTRRQPQIVLEPLPKRREAKSSKESDVRPTPKDAPNKGGGGGGGLARFQSKVKTCEPFDESRIYAKRARTGPGSATALFRPPNDGSDEVMKDASEVDQVVEEEEEVDELEEDEVPMPKVPARVDEEMDDFTQYIEPAPAQQTRGEEAVDEAMADVQDEDDDFMKWCSGLVDG